MSKFFTILKTLFTKVGKITKVINYLYVGIAVCEQSVQSAIDEITAVKPDFKYLDELAAVVKYLAKAKDFVKLVGKWFGVIPDVLSLEKQEGKRVEAFAILNDAVKDVA